MYRLRTRPVRSVVFAAIREAPGGWWRHKLWWAASDVFSRHLSGWLSLPRCSAATVCRGAIDHSLGEAAEAAAAGTQEEGRQRRRVGPSRQSAIRAIRRQATASAVPVSLYFCTAGRKNFNLLINIQMETKSRRRVAGGARHGPESRRRACDQSDGAAGTGCLFPPASLDRAISAACPADDHSCSTLI